MKKSARNQFLLISAGVLVGVLIYLAPDRLSSDQPSEEGTIADTHEHEHNEESHDSTDENKLELDPSQQAYISQMTEKLEGLDNAVQKNAIYDSLIEFSKANNYPPMVANFSIEKAKLNQNELDWMIAGDNCFKAFRLSKNSDKEMVSSAIEAYEEVLKINSNNLTAKTAIGVAYVEGASALQVMPMKGIGLLKAVLDEDPNNIDALTNLGYFSIQSGQYDKAIERFETILSIDSTNAEAYIYLTDIYLSQGDQEKGIETLKQYKSLVDDPMVTKQVDDYIKEIRNK